MFIYFIILSFFVYSMLFSLFCRFQKFIYIYLFFFSSRRRHTRLQGDWSSDVCSSDLDLCAQIGSLVIHCQKHAIDVERWIQTRPHAPQGRHQIGQSFEREILTVEWNERSEERRVGKEWRAGRVEK